MEESTKRLIAAVDAMQQARKVAPLAILRTSFGADAIRRFGMASRAVVDALPIEATGLNRSEDCRIWATTAHNYHSIAWLILLDYWDICDASSDSFDGDATPSRAAISLLGWATGPSDADIEQLKAQLIIEAPMARNLASNSELPRDADYAASPMGQRDRWIHERRSRGDGNPTVIAELEKIFTDRGWEHIATAGGIREALKRWENRGGGAPLPVAVTKGGRPKTRKGKPKTQQ